MLLCATASETNTSREGGAYNPTLQRAAAGPSGFPAGKDLYEGYGMINPDAAVEAVAMADGCFCEAADTLGPGIYDRRVWARAVRLAAGVAFQPQLTVPASADFDLYLYSAEPNTYGTPVILASSTNAGNGIAESINYTPESDANALIVAKRVSGSGTFALTNLVLHRDVIASAGAGGTLEPAGMVRVACGGDVLFHTSPDLGYQVESWYLDGNSVQTGGTEFLLTNVTGDHSLTVQFGLLPQVAVSGHIVNDCGVPIDGVIVEAVIGTTGISDANGFYEVWANPDYTDELMLSKPYYTFSELDASGSSSPNAPAQRDFEGWNAYDYDCDGAIAWGDAAILIDSWLTATGAVPDVGDDMLVNFLEYAMFSNVWLTEYGK